MSNYSLAAMMQALERMVIITTVIDYDPATNRAKVSFGDEAPSGWLECMQIGSKNVRIWCPFTEGTQVVVLSPGGDTTKGIVYPGPFAGNAPDGAAESFRLKTPGVDLRMEGDEMQLTLTTANVKGNIIVDGDVIASGISLVKHVHGGVKAGGAKTAKPS